ncbi:MAG TPA: TonB-dependent receptor, partial [Gemmatimonadaceae bacterium]|nr:TonB-dependent receptor [Gemmatimonadaceae bacterium]
SLFRDVGNFQNITLNQGDKNLLISQFRNAWTPRQTSASPNSSMSLSVGGNDALPGTNKRVGYLLSGTYSYSTDVRRGEQRALANRGATPGATVETDRFDGETGVGSVLWGGIANFSTLLGEHSRLMLNNTYTRTADDLARSETGVFENEGIRARIDRMQYIERAVRSHQLAADHQLGERHRVDWAGTFSGVTRDEPDRSEFVYAIEEDDSGQEVFRWLNTGNGGAVRTFSTLDETNAEGRANYQLTFTAFGRPHLVKVGGLYRSTEREADTRAFAIAAPVASATVRELPPEQLFDGRFTSPTSSLFDLFPLGQGGRYSAADRLTAGYVMTELQATNRLRVILGARYEHADVDVDAHSTLGAPVTTTKGWTDVLPSAVLNVKLTENQALRFSYTGTLARPEYRELAPIKSRDVLNGDDLEGNPDLERTRIQNADARWEWYPDAGEVVSIGLFAKRFDKPVERVYRASGATSRFVAYVNADAAENYGAEVELRKEMGFLSDRLRGVTLFTNATIMQSEIDLGENQAAATNQKRRMVGQAPYVINAGATYSTRSGATSATLLYNRVGERIDAAGDLPLPDVVVQPRDQVDFSLRFPLFGSVSGRFDARNILDAAYETVQGSVVREYYRTGRIFQAGIVWRP